MNSFWKHWSRDVHPLLMLSRKCNTKRINIHICDIAMIADANTVRGKWTIL